MLLAVVATGSVWATTHARTLAPVVTATFKAVPSDRARNEAAAAEPTRPEAPPEAAAPPSATAQERAAVLALFEPLPAQRRPPSHGYRAPAAAPGATRPATASPAATVAMPAQSADADAVLARVRQSGDNGAAPFLIIDKRRARMWLFDASGQPRGDTAVLLGLARGDDTVPGIGDKPLERIRVGERTTPAGRFVAEHGRNARGDDVLWVDYDSAVSIHRVHDVNRGDQRLQRLSTPSAADNRISYGCINVPAAFYDLTLLPLLGGARPVVYLLPETRPVDTIFGTQSNAQSQAHRPSGKTSSWHPSTSTVSVSSSRSTMW